MIESVGMLCARCINVNAASVIESSAFLTMHKQTIKIPTAKRVDVIDVTPLIKKAVGDSDTHDGYAHVFVQHTSCGLAVQEAEVNLVHDVKEFLAQLAPEDPEGARYWHNQLDRRPGAPPNEPLNGDSHLKSLLLSNSRTVPILNGDLALGRWQSVLLFEFDGPRERELVIMVDGVSANDSFASYLKERRELIDAAIGPFLDEHWEGEVVGAARYIAKGGKRLRGALVLLICEALGGNRDKALDAAVALEVLQAASLAKDDLQDGDELRRGGAAAWIAFGIRRAVAMADVMVPHAITMVEKYGREAVSATVKAWAAIGAGQVKDLFITPLRGRHGRGLYDEIVRQKTGTLFGLAATLGAIASNAPPVQRAVARDYGIALGYAFQVMDDLAEKEAGRESTPAFEQWITEQDKSAREKLAELVAEVEKLGGQFPESAYRNYLIKLPTFAWDAMVREEAARKEKKPDVGNSPAAGDAAQAPELHADTAPVARGAGDKPVEPVGVLPGAGDGPGGKPDAGGAHEDLPPQGGPSGG